MSEILNHLEDLSEYGIEYTEEDKSIFVEFENSIVNAEYEIKYMKSPVDIIENKTITAISMKFHTNVILSGIDIFNELIEYIEDNSKYKFIVDKTLYIYKISKLKTINDGITAFSYVIRIGTDTKFN